MIVPVIDLSGPADRVAVEVGAACEEIGFLTVVGHGVPEELVAATAAAGRAFFDLPGEEKRTLAEGEPTPGLPAYRPLRSESLAASLGQRTPGDLKESLDWGPAVPGLRLAGAAARAAARASRSTSPPSPGSASGCGGCSRSPSTSPRTGSRTRSADTRRACG